jgi:nucleoside-triphosphatase THEP1
MTSLETIADAEADIAALVYSLRDRPDLVLCAFARHVTNAGQRPCGLVQLRVHFGDNTARRVVVLDDWQVVNASSKPSGASDDRCSLDSRWLNEMGAQTATSIRRGVDVVIVNRFGPLEANGRGFRDAIRVASETKTPLIIAVPDFEFARWTRFSSGMTVRLDCTLDSVLGWWQRIMSSAPQSIASKPRVCELK